MLQNTSFAKERKESTDCSSRSHFAYRTPLNYVYSRIRKMGFMRLLVVSWKRSTISKKFCIIFNTFAITRHICVTQQFISRTWRHIYVILLITRICVVDYLLINYLFINCWLSILSIVVNYSYICFICIQVNTWHITWKKRHVARKAWVIARIFFNLTMIANMLTTDLKT